MPARLTIVNFALKSVWIPDWPLIEGARWLYSRFINLATVHLLSPWVIRRHQA